MSDVSDGPDLEEREQAASCPVCHRDMTVLGETPDAAALMCGYCTYSCVVPMAQGADGA